MKKIEKYYFIHGNDRKPIVTVGLFIEGTSVIRVLTVYGDGETTRMSKKQAKDTIAHRYRYAQEILNRPDFNNFIHQLKLWKRIKDQPAVFHIPRRNTKGEIIRIKKDGVEQIVYDTKPNEELKNKSVEQLILKQSKLKKIDLHPELTDFEKYLVSENRQ
jgi:hypothetical protein